MAELLWPDGFDERAEVEAEWRGYLNHVRVRRDDGHEVPVHFTDPVRLKQDVESGSPAMVAEVGLIVLPEVTRRAIEEAVASLAPRGFFRRFRPLDDGDLPGGLP